MISCKNFKLLCDSHHTIDMHNVGLWVEDLFIPSVDPSHVTESADGGDGLIHFYTTLRERPLTAILQYDVAHGESVKSFNRKIYDWFSPFRDYYLVADEDPSVRYPVRVSNGYQIDEISWNDGKFTVEFIMFQPLAESINNTKKKYTVTNFRFRNEGTQPIDMRHQTETEITFKGASDNLIITNTTTGDVWEYSGSTTTSDTILLKGVRSLKNGQSIFKDTNKKLISLAIGNNEFEISGATGVFTLEISTRFYFL